MIFRAPANLTHHHIVYYRRGYADLVALTEELENQVHVLVQTSDTHSIIPFFYMRGEEEDPYP